MVMIENKRNVRAQQKYIKNEKFNKMIAIKY